MAGYYSKIGISDGPSLYALSQALFGAITLKKGEIIFPELQFELSKNYFFGWMPKTVGVVVEAIERISMDDWKIEGKIPSEGEKFKFTVQYSVKHRSGAGKIIFLGHPAMSDPMSYCLLIIDKLQTPLHGKKIEADDVLECAIRLWHDVGKNKALVMAEALNRLSNDFRVDYLTKKLIETLKKTKH